jgi:phospholipid-binding lipoprotein MlaA
MKLRAIFLVTIFAFFNFSALAKDNYNYNYAELNERCGIYDPYESINRKVFIFNGILDTFILRPITKGYGRFTNDYTQERVGSFVDNLKAPLTTTNYLLQGSSEGMFKSFWRFAVNSTFGLAGFFDVASKFDLQTEPQTFGSTLASHGVGPGPYIVLPIYGGMSTRDVTDPLFTSSFLNPIQWQMHSDFKNTVTVARTIHSRHRIMPFTDYVTKNSPDTYIAMRDAALSQREAKMEYPEGFKCPKVNK